MTIRDVAEYSGVSVSTVSRVLNHHPDVSEAVRGRVMEAVRELRYVPNDSARDLVKSQSDAIGVVVRGASNPFFAPVIRAIEEEAETAGCAMVLHQIRAGEDEIAAGAALARSKRLSGLILLGGRYDYTPSEVELLEVPFVCCTYTNHFGSLGQAEFSSVSIDDEAEAYRAVKMLTERGHRKIAVLLESANDRSISQLRYLGYCRAIRECGGEIDPSLVAETVDFSMSAAREAVRALLEKRPDVTAIFAVADTFAIAAMKALSEAGKRVPKDCSVIAIDGIEMSLYTVPTLTTLEQPQETMGAEAVRILMELRGGRRDGRHVLLPTKLREGNTVAECPGGDAKQGSCAGDSPRGR